MAVRGCSNGYQGVFIVSMSESFAKNMGKACAFPIFLYTPRDSND